MSSGFLHCASILILLALIATASGQCLNLTQQIVKERVDFERAAGETPNSNVTILEWRVDCLASFGTLDRYTRATFTAKYQSMSGAIEMAQIDVTCSNSIWIGSSSFDSLTLAEYNNILASPPRTDCDNCNSLFGGLTHCNPCPPSCSEGAGLCYTSGSVLCCNYFDNTNCVTQCPLNKVPDQNNICTCQNVFLTGSDCSNCVIQSSDCINGGIANTTSCTCQCDSTGYTGVTCSQDIDECSLPSSPCQNNGTCQNTNGTYACLCTPGYTGTNCSVDIDECEPEPCRNGGTCIDRIAGYTCNCSAGFTDNNCSTNIDDCLGDPCKNNGVCMDKVNDYTCNCTDGFGGKNCSIEYCKADPCQNGGSCFGVSGGYGCTCSVFYHGRNCTLDVDECSNGTSPCANEGTCSNSVGGFSCLCSGGWEGDLCERCGQMSGCAQTVCSTRTGHQCVQCQSGYSLVNSVCVTCNVKDCLACSSKDVCSSCNSSSVLDGNNVCIPSIATDPPTSRGTGIDTGAIIGIVIAFIIVLLVIVIVILVVIAVLAKANSKKPPTYHVKTPKPEDKDIILTKISNI